MILRMGCSRLVLLVGDWAIKLPNWRYGWRAFLRGLLHNMEEASVWGDRYGYTSGAGWKDFICPVLFSLPGGWLVVMRRCDPVSPETCEGMDRTPYADIAGDVKHDNLGYLPDGRIVLVDYAQAPSESRPNGRSRDLAEVAA